MKIYELEFKFFDKVAYCEKRYNIMAASKIQIIRCFIDAVNYDVASKKERQKIKEFWRTVKIYDIQLPIVSSKKI